MFVTAVCFKLSFVSEKLIIPQSHALTEENCLRLPNAICKYAYLTVAGNSITTDCTVIIFPMEIMSYFPPFSPNNIRT